MIQNFPYTDMHQLNLDWIIKIAKDFLDQYTHIQQLIADGEESLQNLTTEGSQQLQNLTTEGLQQLQNKADNLEALLQAWYNEHSTDIANQLANAIADLNAWYNSHISSIDTALQEALADFATRAEITAREVIETIPSDYTALAAKVTMLETYTVDTAGDIYLTMDNTLADWELGGLTSDGQPQTDTTNIRTVDFIDVRDAKKLLVNSTLNYWVFWYDAIGHFLNRESGWQTGLNIYDTTATNKNYAKILLHTPNVVDYTEIDITKLEKLLATEKELETLGTEGRVNTEYLTTTYDWTLGGISSTGQNNNDDTTHFRSGFAYVKNCEEIIITNTQIRYWVFWYDEGKNFIGRESGWQTGTNSYQITGTKAYMRILGDYNSKNAWVWFRIVGNPQTLVSYTEMNNAIKEIEPRLDYAIKHYNLTSSTLQNGNLLSDGSYDPNGIYVVTKFIPINGADKLHVNVAGYRYWVFWYDAGRNYINRMDDWVSTTSDVKVPRKSSYARILIDCRTGYQTLVELPTTDVHTEFIKYDTTKRLLYDTDLDLDVDDAVALRCLVWANRNHSVDVVGICTSIDGSITVDDTTYYSASFIDAMLNYDGTPEIPLAVNHGRVAHNCHFIKDIVSGYYHTVPNNDLPDAVDLYRAALGSLPDGIKLDICNVGYNLNIASLINSPADDYIPKTGLELIAEHVNNFYIMGGDYPQSGSTAEGNFSNGTGAVQATNTMLTANITNKMIFLGRESGWPVQSGGSLSDKFNDPLYKALTAYNGGTFSPRSSYDPLTILIACLGHNQMGFETIRGTNVINTESGSDYGKNTFTENDTGHHYYVRYKYPSDMNYYVNIINTILVRFAWQ